MKSVPPRPFPIVLYPLYHLSNHHLEVIRTISLQNHGWSQEQSLPHVKFHHLPFQVSTLSLIYSLPKRPRWLGDRARERDQGQCHRGWRHYQHGRDWEWSQSSNTCSSWDCRWSERRLDGQFRSRVSSQTSILRIIDLYICAHARHLNIGAGRIVWQDIVRIDVSIKKKQFHKSPKIVESMQRAKDGNGRLHLLGLVWVFSI